MDPIRHGTDAALVNALAYVMITENLVDQPFLDKYCVGYDEKTLPASAPANGHYKAYILGQGSDGVAKTPEWASTITGIPVERIVRWPVKLVQRNRPISAVAGAAASRERRNCHPRYFYALDSDWQRRHSRR